MALRSSIGLRALLTCLFLALAAAPAAAQNTRDLSVGYSFLWLSGEEAPGGWQVAYASEITPLMRWVADVSGHYGGDESIHLFTGGLRFGLRRSEPVVPFAVVRFGGGYGAKGDADVDGTLTFAAMLGAGLDFVFRPDGPGIRVQADFPAFFVDDGPEVGARVTVGFVFPFK